MYIFCGGGILEYDLYRKGMEELTRKGEFREDYMLYMEYMLFFIWISYLVIVL